MFTKPNKLVIGVMKDVFAPRPRLGVTAWADKFRTIAMGASKGQWQTSRVPYLREIQDSYNDPSVRVLVIMKSGQSGGTESIFNMVLSDVCEDPADTMMVLPTQKKAERVNKRRFTPALMMCQPAVERLVKTGKAATGSETVFRASWIFWAGSNSQSETESFPFSRVFIDEFDRCDPETFERCVERVKTFGPVSKVVICGTPGFAGEGIDLIYSGATSVQDDDDDAGIVTEESKRRDAVASDQRRWYVPCRACGYFYTHEEEGIRWKGGLAANPDEVARTAWYTCPFCKAANTADTHLWQAGLGLWLPKGQGVEPIKAADSRPLPESKEIIGGARIGPAPSNSVRGYRITGMMSTLENNPYGAIARKFVRIKGHRSFMYVTSVVGNAYARKGLSASIKELLSRRATYRKGTVPAGVVAVTAEIDIQTHHKRLYVEVVGWHAGGKVCSLIDYWSEPFVDGKALQEVDAIMAKKFPLSDDETKSVGIHAVIIDSGDDSHIVYPCVRRLRSKKVLAFAAKGRAGSQISVDKPYTYSDLGTDNGGTPVPSLLINTDYWKMHVLSRLAPRAAEAIQRMEGSAQAASLEQAVEERESERVSTPMDEEPDRWEFPADTEPAYFLQLTAEHRVQITNRAGRTLWTWQKKPGRDNNHYLDCRVYGSALAEYLHVRKLKPLTSAPAAASAPAGAPGPAPAPAPTKKRGMTTIAAALNRGR